MRDEGDRWLIVMILLVIGCGCLWVSVRMVLVIIVDDSREELL